jgi:MFS family permease
VQVVIAALAMVGTFPGRSQALGIITTQLQANFHLTDVEYAKINFWATLLGASACVGFGRLIDRFGVRWVTTALALGLGLVAWGTTLVSTVMGLALALTLSRALGQSALSVASISITPQWFGRRLPLAMSIYSVILSVGFAIAFLLAGDVVKTQDWRVLWRTVSWLLVFGLAPVAALLLRRGPEELGWQREPESSEDGSALEKQVVSVTFRQALGSSAFWAFAIGAALYALIASGAGLFNEAIFLERHFTVEDFHTVLAVTALSSLTGNFLAGWLTNRMRLSWLMAGTMALLAASLVAFLFVENRPQLWLQSAAMGVSGGFVMVLFFAIWGRAFGPAQLGLIQGTAQVTTVLASALGPVVFAGVREWTHSYRPLFWGLATAVAITGCWCGLVRLPNQQHPTRRASGSGRV